MGECLVAFLTDCQEHGHLSRGGDRELQGQDHRISDCGVFQGWDADGGGIDSGYLSGGFDGDGDWQDVPEEGSGRRFRLGKVDDVLPSCDVRSQEKLGILGKAVEVVEVYDLG